MTEHENIIQEFLIESNEALDRMNTSLLELEKGKNRETHIGNIFRGFHTVKGACGFLGFSQLEKLAHAAENLLDKIRAGRLTPDTDVVNTLLKSCDSIKRCLIIIKTTLTDNAYDPSELVVELEEISRQKENTGETIKSDSADVVPGLCSDLSDNTIRLDITLLDKLMNLVGELVLARNKVLQVSSGLSDVNLASSSQHINLITTELQETVMKTRLQPISNVWHHFPRVARDMALACGKSVEILMHGEDTELDKTIIEAIKDPLIHLLRNAVDHGIEQPEERLKAEKPEKGLVTLNAFHEGGQVNIEISDDGRGIDLEKIARKLVQTGALTTEAIEAMTERDLIMMIFTPGFSTAREVTKISGRGVGMDVVKTNIEKIGGSVDAFTKKGKGTTFKIKIPLTLAIIPALIVGCAGQRYAIPQVNLMELVRIDKDSTGSGIEYVHNAPVYRLRGSLLPLVYLKNILGLSGESSDGETAVSIIVLKYLEKTFGLVVDEITDTQEIVVKPLGKQLKHTREFSGATITGDGQVALILDVMGIAQSVRITEEGVQSRTEFQHEMHTYTTTNREDSLLFFKVAGKMTMAMPLVEVARLEEIPSSSVQNAADREVIQYRGRILPLIRLNNLYPGTGQYGNETGNLSVIVHQSGGRPVGFVVDGILDIAESHIISRNDSPINGIKYSALIGERVTDILDTQKTIARFLPDYNASQVQEVNHE